VASTAQLLREQVAHESDPLERLHRFIIEYYRMCGHPISRAAQPRTGAPPVVTDFAQQLLTDRPKEAARAFAPLVAMFGELLADATAAGLVRPELPARRITGVVLQAVMFNVFSSTISGTPAHADDAAAEELWSFVLNGVGTTPT